MNRNLNKNFKSLVAAGILALSLSACASTDTAQKTAESDMVKTEAMSTTEVSKAEPKTEEKVMKEASVKKDKTAEKKKKKKKSKGLTETFPVSLEDARTAVMRSMRSNGFTVKNRSNDYIDGSRSHSIGSGGEVIKIHFDAIDENTTKIKVRNKKTLFGWALQENWENEIMSGVRAQITKMQAAGS